MQCLWEIKQDHPEPNSQCNGNEHVLGETLAPRQLHCRSLFTEISYLPAFTHSGLFSSDQIVSPLVGITGWCFFYQVETQRHSLTLKIKWTGCFTIRTHSHFLYNQFTLIEFMRQLPWKPLTPKPIFSCDVEEVRLQFWLLSER